MGAPGMVSVDGGNTTYASCATNLRSGANRKLAVATQVSEGIHVLTL